MASPVEFSKALADPTRWRIIRLAMMDPLCVCELADVLEMPQSSVSSHVQVIRRAGLLESEKAEKWTYFQVRSEYLDLIQTISALFPEGTGFREDDERMEKRLSQRRGSCCPGPNKLQTRRENSSTP